MLLFDGELLDAAEETGMVEKRSSVFFGRGFLGLGCPCNWAVFRLGEGQHGTYSFACCRWKRASKKDLTAVDL
jgi:hypothetical protein